MENGSIYNFINAVIKTNSGGLLIIFSKAMHDLKTLEATVFRAMYCRLPIKEYKYM